MGKKNRKQCRNQNDIEGSTDGEKHVRRTGGVPLWLPPGSLAPRSRTKRSWKEKCMQLREGYKILKEKIEKYEDEHKILAEKIKQYEDEINQLKQISREHADRLVELGANDIVQIGNHNLLQVVNNFDPSFLKELLDKYEDKIKEDSKQRKSMQDQIHVLSSRIKEMTDTHKRCDEQLLDCGRLTSHMRELHHLTNSEMACPIDSIVKMSQQATDLFKTFTPEIMRLQDTIRSLSAYIDDPKLDLLLSVSSPNRSLSTVSLDEKRTARFDDRHQCQRNAISELHLNVHV